MVNIIEQNIDLLEDPLGFTIPRVKKEVEQHIEEFGFSKMELLLKEGDTLFFDVVARERLQRVYPHFFFSLLDKFYFSSGEEKRKAIISPQGAIERYIKALLSFGWLPPGRELIRMDIIVLSFLYRRIFHPEYYVFTVGNSSTSLISRGSTVSESFLGKQYSLILAELFNEPYLLPKDNIIPKELFKAASFDHIYSSLIDYSLEHNVLKGIEPTHSILGAEEKLLLYDDWMDDLLIQNMRESIPPLARAMDRIGEVAIEAGHYKITKEESRQIGQRELKERSLLEGKLEDSLLSALLVYSSTLTWGSVWLRKKDRSAKAVFLSSSGRPPVHPDTTWRYELELYEERQGKALIKPLELLEEGLDYVVNKVGTGYYIF